MSKPWSNDPQYATELAEAFAAQERMQTVLNSIQAVEMEKKEDGTQSFVELLKPSPTVEDAMVGIGVENYGVEVGGRTLKAVIGKLEMMLMGMEKKSITDGTLEAKLQKFEEEVEMPEEGRGGLYGLIREPGATVDACVMFLSTYFDAAAPEENTTVAMEENVAAEPEGNTAAEPEGNAGGAGLEQ